MLIKRVATPLLCIMLAACGRQPADTSAAVQPVPTTAPVTPAPSFADATETRVKKLLEQKKERAVSAIETTPVKFANTRKVAQLYGEEVSLEEKQRIEREGTKSVNGGLEGSAAVVKAKAEGSAGTRTTEIYEVSRETVNQQLRAAIAALLKKDGTVLLDAEYEFSDSRRISALATLLLNLKEQFQVDIAALPAIADAQKRVNLEAAKPTLDRLYKDNGRYAIIVADWTIDPANEYHLSYQHPITKLMQVSPVTIDIVLPSGSDGGVDADFLSELRASKGSIVPYTVFGVVSVPKDANDKISKVSISPIGIYGGGR